MFAKWRSLPRPVRTIRYALVGVALLAVVSVPAPRWILPSGVGVWVEIACLLIMTSLGVAEGAVLRRARRLEFLICPECGYTLSGIETGRCPECGEASDPATLRIRWSVRGDSTP